jgi:cytochrome oxidase Cu insertion factor (SCO1/SenC/PrrC family)
MGVRRPRRCDQADASKDQEFVKKLLEWYSRPSGGTFPPAATAEPNVYGIRGLHGLAWEWVQDFNSTMVVGDSRGDNSLERNLFCGGASLLASDVSNYSAFMRYAFRSSLKGTYCVNSLGFRGAQSLNGPTKAGAGTGFTTIYDLPDPWTNQNRRASRAKQLGGKVRVIAMGFTRCNYACPRILSDMQQIEKSLGPAADEVGFVFFSIDPENDTPEAMAAKMAELKMAPGRWTFLAAPVETVRTLAVALDFKFEKVEGFFAHSNLIAVLDPEGRVVHREESLGADIAPTVAALRKLLTP